jgi:hypothetical protein
MKHHVYILIVAIFGFGPVSRAQVITTVDCDLMGLVCNVCSQTNMINLYHPGGYLTWPPSENVMEWEFTDSEGNLLHEETLVDDNFVSFDFDIPLTDTMFVSVLHTNDSAWHNGSQYSWACLIEDYLVWEVDTWPNSGEEYGTWTLGGNVGLDVSEPIEPDCSLQYDGDGDGTVTVVDVLGLLSEFGQSCEDPSYTVEGRWLWSPSDNVEDANTMYEYLNGLRYTFYCEQAECNEDYWNALDIADAIPNPVAYSLDGDTLTIDGTAFAVTFECDGGILHFSLGGQLWRLGADCPE